MALGVSYRFTRMGQEAADTLPPGEIWVDVGGRNEGRVFDHHGEETRFRSATEMVAERAAELHACVRSTDGLVVVTHETPDLDAIGSVWLILQIRALGPDFVHEDGMRPLLQAIGDNDQGICLGEVESWWPAVFGIRLGCDLQEEESDSLRRLQCGIQLLDETYRYLRDGKSLAEAAEALKSFGVRSYLFRARADYEEDLLHSISFQLRLPLTHPALRGGRGSLRGETALVDALYLPNPRCILFKEMARTDQANSFQGHGFPVLVVSRPLKRALEEIAGRKAPPSRFTASVDPMAGVHLQNLGLTLEAAEQALDASGAGLKVKERRKLPEGQGRFGLEVASPWYDGRGHGYTIVDSPSFSFDGQNYCGSALTAEEVLNVIWKYGAPANFIPLEEAVVTFFVPAGYTEGGRAAHYADSIPFPDGLKEDLTSTVQQILHFEDADQPLARWRCKDRNLLERFVPEDLQGKLSCETAEIWEYERALVWAVRFAAAGIQSLQDWTGAVAALRRHVKNFLASGDFSSRESLGDIRRGDLFHVVFCKARLEDLSFKSRHPFILGTVYQLSEGDPPIFVQLPTESELSHMKIVSSHDGFSHSCFSSKGVACVSLEEARSREGDHFYHQSSVEILTACALAQKHCLDILLAQFTEHKYDTPIKGAQRVLRDRTELLALEQSVLFDTVTEHYYGQSYFAQLRETLQVSTTLDVTRAQIESLAVQVKEHREHFVGRMLFWLTLFLVPFTFVLGMFSGNHMDRNFASNYRDPLIVEIRRLLSYYSVNLEQWVPADYWGWLSFSAYFCLGVFLVFIIWCGVRLSNRNLKLRYGARRWFNPRFWISFFDKSRH